MTTTEPGLHSAVLAREEHEEFFVTALICEGEDGAALFERTARVVGESGARIVSMDVFGIPGREAPHIEAFGAIDWPVTWIVGKPDCTTVPGGLQIWGVKGLPVEPVEIAGRIVGSTWSDRHARYCRLGGLRPDVGGGDRVFQTEKTLVLAAAALAKAGMGFGDVVRTWFFLDSILAWYGAFNRTRDTFYKPRGVFEGLVPASTGMGGGNPAGTALEAGFMAVHPSGPGLLEIHAVPSPLQGPALEYGSSFSRAVEAVFPDHRRLFVSGTASIDREGRTVFTDDAAGQVRHTMNVVQAILESRGMVWKDVTRAVAYFKKNGIPGEFEADLESRGIRSLSCATICNDVCRDELLFEIEVDAVKVIAGGRQARGTP